MNEEQLWHLSRLSNQIASDMKESAIAFTWLLDYMRTYRPTVPLDALKLPALEVCERTRHRLDEMLKLLSDVSEDTEDPHANA